MCANKFTPKRSTEIYEFPSMDTSCPYGDDSIKSDPNFVACADGNRRSRCPCLKANKGCGMVCACKNCENAYGQNKQSVASPVSRKRKRGSASPYKRVRSAKYLASNNVGPNIIRNCGLFISNVSL